MDLQWEKLILYVVNFSKKTGTETDIPIIKDGGYMTNIDGKKSEHYIKGFIKTMKDDYDVEQEDAEQIIESFYKLLLTHLIICFQRIMPTHIHF